MTARPIRRFTELLGLLDGGKFERACDEALSEALGVLESLPKEEGTAKINIEVSIAYQSGRVDILPVLKSKLPEGQVFGRTPLWVAEGALSTQHPNQIDMFVKPAQAAETKVG